MAGRLLLGLGDPHCRKETWYKYGIKKIIEWMDKEVFPPKLPRDRVEVLITGDSLDDVLMDPKDSAAAVEFFNYLTSKASTVYAILGNHDYGLEDYKIIDASPFLESLGVTVIKEVGPMVTNLGFKLFNIPWVPKTKHNEINELLKSYTNNEYDVVTSHWELEKSIMSEHFVDVHSLKAKAYMCGHIHQHSFNPDYLGSLLPNNISEVKDKNPSVIRMLFTQDGNSEYILKDFPIPSVVHIVQKEITSVNDLDQFELKEDTFYKIEIDSSLDKRLVRLKAKNLGIQVYDIEKIKKAKAVDGVSTALEGEKLLKPKTKLEMLKCIQQLLSLSDEDLEVCKQYIELAS